MKVPPFDSREMRLLTSRIWIALTATHPVPVDVVKVMGPIVSIEVDHDGDLCSFDLHARIRVPFAAIAKTVNLMYEADAIEDDPRKVKDDHGERLLPGLERVREIMRTKGESLTFEDIDRAISLIKGRD